MIIQMDFQLEFTIDFSIFPPKNNIQNCTNELSNSKPIYNTM